MSAVSDLLRDYQHVIEEIRLVTGDDSAFEVVVNGNLVYSKHATGLPDDPTQDQTGGLNLREVLQGSGVDIRGNEEARDCFSEMRLNRG